MTILLTGKYTRYVQSAAMVWGILPFWPPDQKLPFWPPRGQLSCQIIAEHQILPNCHAWIIYAALMIFWPPWDFCLCQIIAEYPILPNFHVWTIISVALPPPRVAICHGYHGYIRVKQMLSCVNYFVGS